MTGKHCGRHRHGQRAAAGAADQRCRRPAAGHARPYTAPETAARRITAFDKGETVLLCVCPIVVQGDVEGGVLLTGRPQDAAPDTETARAVNIAAAFLAKWMEE